MPHALNAKVAIFLEENKENNVILLLFACHIMSFGTASNLKFKYDSEEEEEEDGDNFELHDNSIENGVRVPIHDLELDNE